MSCTLLTELPRLFVQSCSHSPPRAALGSAYRAVVTLLLEQAMFFLYKAEVALLLELLGLFLQRYSHHPPRAAQALLIELQSPSSQSCLGTSYRAAVTLLQERPQALLIELQSPSSQSCLGSSYTQKCSHPPPRPPSSSYKAAITFHQELPRLLLQSCIHPPPGASQTLLIQQSCSLTPPRAAQVLLIELQSPSSQYCLASSYKAAVTLLLKLPRLFLQSCSHPPPRAAQALLTDLQSPSSQSCLGYSYRAAVTILLELPRLFLQICSHHPPRAAQAILTDLQSPSSQSCLGSSYGCTELQPSFSRDAETHSLELQTPFSNREIPLFRSFKLSSKFGFIHKHQRIYGYSTLLINSWITLDFFKSFFRKH